MPLFSYNLDLKMGVCRKLSLCFLGSIIIFGAGVFIFITMFKDWYSDPRVKKIRLKEEVTFLHQNSNVYLRKIDQFGTKPTDSHFEFIEIMDDSSPNLLGQDILFLICTRNEMQDSNYLNFVETIFRGSSNSIPIYILKEIENLKLQSETVIESYIQEIASTIKYFINILNTKQLSILAFEKGALLTLSALAKFADPRFLQNIHKVVLINPFNPRIKIYDSSPFSYVNQIKSQIVTDPIKLQFFNQLRLIVILTTKTFYFEHQTLEEYFYFCFREENTRELHRFNNTFTVSSRSMWNIYAFLKDDEYFRFEPFLWLLGRFFTEDMDNKFSMKELHYFFSYRETTVFKELSEKRARKYIPKCYDFYLEQYSYKGNTFTEECVRFLRKETIYFENATILLFSEDKFQVFGENYEKLYPMESKLLYMIYHIENLNAFNRLYLINSKKVNVHLLITPVYQPQTNAIVSFADQILGKRGLSEIEVNNMTIFSVIKTCETAALVFPIHFGRVSRWGESLLFMKQSEHNCYSEYDNYNLFPDWFVFHEDILRNLMLFSLFCSHVLERSAFSRFFTQLLTNTFLFNFVGNRFLPLQNFIVLSTVVVIQVLIWILCWISSFLTLPKPYTLKLLWIPMLFELLREVHPYDYPSPWKLLSIQLILALNPQNAILVFTKIQFMLDRFSPGSSNLYGITIISIWEYITTVDYDDSERATRLRENKVKVTNYFFMFVMAFCIREDGNVLHQILNFYVIARALLFANEKLRYLLQ